MMFVGMVVGTLTKERLLIFAEGTTLVLIAGSLLAWALKQWLPRFTDKQKARLLEELKQGEGA